MSSVFIIAEAGVNHNGHLDLALQLVDAAIDANADAIKFQTFKTEHLVTRDAIQAEYQAKNMGESISQFQMLKKLELKYEEFRVIKDYCQKRGIIFLSTPFDFDSIDFLLRELNLKTIKIPSGEITNAPYLYKVASFKPKVIISTGMATIEEIHKALAFLAYGFANMKNISLQNVLDFYKTIEAKKLLKRHVTILHCTSEYPTPIEEVNLNAIDVLKNEFKFDIGLSDHSEGILIPIAAVAKGATIIEKHFTLDKNLPGPDHKASLEPDQLKEMILSIRTIERALGNKEKRPTETELKNKHVSRKSLVANKVIKKGEIYSSRNLTVKRPGTGVSPYYYWDYLGSKADRDYMEDEVIR